MHDAHSHFASLPVLVAAAGAGVVHALVPCAHSWPVLVPVSARLKSVGRVSGWYGAGVTVGAAALGFVTGGGGGLLAKALPTRGFMWVENAFGAAMLIVGIVIMARTKLAHSGHVHGDCAPQDQKGTPPPCGHADHGVVAYRKFGTNGGLLALGLISVTVPCFSNSTAVLLSVAESQPIAGACVFGVYGLAAAITNDVVLRVVRKGRRAFSVLSHPKFESRLMWFSGAVLALIGVLTLLHIGHDHSHP